MAQRSVAKDDMSCGKHHMWHAVKMLALGAIVLLNVYQPFISWWTLIGTLLVIMGLIKLMMPGCCSHHKH